MLEKRVIETELTIVLRPGADGTIDLHRGWQKQSFVVMEDGAQLGGVQQGSQINLDGELLATVLPDRADLVAELATARETVTAQDSEIGKQAERIDMLVRQLGDAEQKIAGMAEAAKPSESVASD